MTPELEQLVAGIELSDRFQLFLLVCDGTDVPAAFACWLAERLDTRVERLDAPHLAVPLALSLLTARILEPLLTSSAAPCVVDLCSYKAADDDAWELLYQRMNEVRNHIRDARAAPLVLCLSEHRVSVFARLAPDVWSIRSSLALARVEAFGRARHDVSVLIGALVHLTSARPVVRNPEEEPEPHAGASPSDVAAWAGRQLEVADAYVAAGRAPEAAVVLAAIEGRVAGLEHPAFAPLRAGVGNRRGEDPSVWLQGPVTAGEEAAFEGVDAWVLYKAASAVFPEGAVPPPDDAPYYAGRFAAALDRGGYRRTDLAAPLSALLGRPVGLGDRSSNMDVALEIERAWFALDRDPALLEQVVTRVAGAPHRTPAVLGILAAAASRRAAHGGPARSADLAELMRTEEALGATCPPTPYGRLRRLAARVAFWRASPLPETPVVDPILDRLVSEGVGDDFTNTPWQHDAEVVFASVEVSPSLRSSDP